ncbi:hypothetical protein CK203_042508 [Vitis vinifera]|uniref:Uncharacterized protein n=1 Tax=Vitis vinifera TaxID=29760 RepID=A0A438HF67_VITVI|nr:hypothetical protein CK203_042508 [Vitis vinifera]
MTNQGKKEWWTLRVDGASRSSGSGVGLLLQSPTGEHLEQAIRLGFSASNNEAEYEAILSGLDLALALSVSKLRIYSDSQLVVKHVQEEYEAKDARMARYLATVRDTLQQFTEWKIEKIKRADNRRADALAGIAASLPIKEAILLPIHVQPTPLSQKFQPAIPLRHPKRTAENGYWGAPLQAILHRTLPSMPRAFRGLVCSHSTCAVSNVKVSLSPMALCAVGMDIVGPLPAAPAQKKFLLVATDYFSKWVEAEAYASIKDKDVTKNFCSELNIRNSYSTPRYPQSNGQAEATNKTLINALKKRLEQAKGKWVEELPGVLWAYRTTPERPTGNTPFALAYGMDAVIPTEIVRESAAIRMADYQQRASAHYNRKVRPRSFKNAPIPKDERIIHLFLIFCFKFLLSAANSRSSSSFCATKRSCKSSLCFFSIETSVRSCLTSPSAGPSHLLPHAGRSSLIPPGSLPQPNPPGGLHFLSNGPPPDEAAEGDFCSDEGPQHLRPDGPPRMQPQPGPPPGRLESQLPSPLRPPSRMSVIAHRSEASLRVAPSPEQEPAGPDRQRVDSGFLLPLPPWGRTNGLSCIGIRITGVRWLTDAASSAKFARRATVAKEVLEWFSPARCPDPLRWNEGQGSLAPLSLPPPVNNGRRSKFLGRSGAPSRLSMLLHQLPPFCWSFLWRRVCVAFLSGTFRRVPSFFFFSRSSRRTRRFSSVSLF